VRSAIVKTALASVPATRVGPINAQAAGVLEMLTDHRRCRVVLVTLPEEVHTGSPREAFCPEATASSRSPG